MMDYLQDYFETKSIQSLHKWVEENYKMFHHIVSKMQKQYSLYDLDSQDLFSEAIICFYEVIDGYKPEAGKFSTFIYRAITNGLLTKLRHSRTIDFQRRVDVVDIDETYEDASGYQMSRESVISVTDEDSLMRGVMVGELNEYVETHLPPRKKAIYKLYCKGLNIPQVANKLGVTKQYVSKVLQDLVEDVRKEWKVSEQSN